MKQYDSMHRIGIILVKIKKRQKCIMKRTKKDNNGLHKIDVKTFLQM